MRRGSPRSSPAAESSSTIRVWAWRTVRPASSDSYSAAAAALEPGRSVPQQPAVATDDGPHRQAQLAPPHHVGRVAKGADHGRAGALVGLGQGMGEHRHLDAEDRRPHGAADGRGEAGVVGMDDHRHARRQQLRPGGVDQQLARRRWPRWNTRR